MKTTANPSFPFPTAASGLATLALVAMSVLVLPATGDAQQVDIEKIFDCSEGAPLGPQSTEECAEARSLVLNNCTACHSFVPIVKAQKDEDAWNATLNPHRERMSDVSDDDYEKIGVFLKAHYNPENDPPELPPALEALSDIPQ